MATTSELEELSGYIRQTLPDQKAILRLQKNEQAGIVEFTWHARQFVVRPNLEVFELKGKNLLITGASMLMQAALKTKEKNKKVIEAVVDTLHAAEENMRGNTSKGLALLTEVKKILARLAGKQA